MKQIKLLKIISLSFFSISIFAKLNTVDKTLAIVYHAGGSTAILQSDLRPGIDGSQRNLKQAVLDKLIAFDGEINLKINITQEDVDRHLIQVQKQYNLSKEDTVKLFKDMGFTFDEAREQLKTRLLIDNVVEYRVKGKCIVDKKEIENYYNSHPIYQESLFVISQAFVPFDMGSKAIKKITVKDAIESGEILNMIQWSSPVELKADQFAADKAFIKDLEPGAIIELNETEEGINLIRLISKQVEKLIPLEERIKDITNELSKGRFHVAFEDYQSEILKKSHVKYFDNLS